LATEARTRFSRGASGFFLLDQEEAIDKLRTAEAVLLHGSHDDNVVHHLHADGAGQQRFSTLGKTKKNHTNENNGKKMLWLVKANPSTVWYSFNALLWSNQVKNEPQRAGNTAKIKGEREGSKPFQVIQHGPLQRIVVKIIHNDSVGDSERNTSSRQQD
jgi:hypothetical protein